MEGFPPVFLDTVLVCDGGIIGGKSIIAMTAANYAKGKPKEGGEDTNRSQARLLSSARKICFRSLIHNVKRY